MSEYPLIRVNFHLRTDQIAKMEAICKVSNTRRAALIRKGIDMFLDQVEKTRPELLSELTESTGGYADSLSFLDIHREGSSA